MSNLGRHRQRRRLDSKTLHIAVVLALGLCSACPAATFSNLNIDQLGRCGGTHGLVASAGDLDNTLWNPSGLGFFTGRTVFAGFMDYLVGVRGGSAGYVAAADNVGLGAYFSYLSSGSLTRTTWDDPTGMVGETFSHSEFAVGFSQGLRLRPYFAVGTGLKLAHQDLDESEASALMLDVTSTLRLYPWCDGCATSPAVYTALVSRNMALVRWQDQDGEAPRNSEVGLAVRWPESRLSYGVSFYFGRHGRREIRTGMSARVSKEFEMRLAYRRRTGAFSDRGNDLPIERGLLAGFGIGFGRLWIDYTFEDASPLDAIHRFGIRAMVR
jgi:hypothetical protein